MKLIAEERAKQLRDHPDLRKRGVRSPSIGGTHVIYVLHDATDPERYARLAEGHRKFPELYTIWKVAVQPVLERLLFSASWECACITSP